MAKQTSTNTQNNRYPYPQKSVPSRNRGESNSSAQHEKDIAKLDRMHPPEKGGCGK